MGFTQNSKTTVAQDAVEITQALLFFRFYLEKILLISTSVYIDKVCFIEIDVTSLLPPNIDDALYVTDPNVDQDGMQLHLKRKAYEERQKQMIAMHHNRGSMYAYILSKLTVENVDQIKRHNKFKKFDDDKSPLHLWMAIKEVHIVTTMSKVESRIKARDEYYACKQG